MSVPARLLEDVSYASAERREIREEAHALSPARGGVPIELRGVSKSFGAREVLKDLDLTIHAGEFVVVVGRSGGGKSTLLRLVAGLERLAIS
jgi:sulfonate transport system ATP-binding protein